MADMERNESIERFKEGLSKAADRARALVKAQGNTTWLQVATGFDQMRTTGMVWYNAKAISRQQALAMLDAREATKKSAEVN